jgi:Zn-dependent M28 family amino/carboxypeptidase
MVPGKPADYWEEWDEWYEELEKLGKVIRFFQEEGVAALLIPSSRDKGVVRVSSSGIEKVEKNAPTFVVARESFNMLARLVDRGFEPKVRLQSRVEIVDDVKGYNVIAEIPGSDPTLRDELVIIGGHLDAWHAGTGATDNAAGCAVAMEAMRILTAIGATPRRTIRVALWDGEELDYSGSVHHVAEHFADLESMELKPDHARLSAYYNYDSGTGRIRGIHLQGNEWVRPIFEAYLEPFSYLGADTVTTKNTSGTDHVVFDAVGLPAFTFIQDPIDYTQLTHHTDQDVYDRLVEDDLMQSAVIMASFAYHTAMREEILPRKKLPPKKESARDTRAEGE